MESSHRTPFHPPERSASLQSLIRHKLPELVELERLLAEFNSQITHRVLGNVTYQEHSLPIYAIDLGTHDANKPRLLICGGVHGVERIGTHVVLALCRVWFRRMQWEKSLLECFRQISVTFIPIVNPVGMLLGRRSNGNGVDLMRNAPIDAEDAPFMVSGQRISSWLPWYRGKNNEFELENKLIENEVQRLTQETPLLLSLDCHSGYGVSDRIWFPYAYRRRPMNDIAPVVALKLLWESSYPNHRYVFEPQSNNYLTHGDIWDYFYKKYGRNRALFLPLTLEMGSWNWVRKRPLQLLKFEGLFNPLVPHRQQRTLRRHLPLMDFLRHAVNSFENWVPNPDEKRSLTQMAHSLWYKDI
ncbi:DUF2817 domain-containing protein [Pleionea sediminis]|uniref:DUF2817 domain-containing protein n=1 Tax=Pleionea sediminis TaxID=2569479 RepID=UPI001186A139|nr:DUF2817 domain-containing protein [Pleionea sediminis]